MDFARGSLVSLRQLVNESIVKAKIPNFSSSCHVSVKIYIYIFLSTALGRDFTSWPSDFEAEVGDVARFECRIESVPEPSITWEKDGEPVLTAFDSRYFKEINMFFFMFSLKKMLFCSGSSLRKWEFYTFTILASTTPAITGYYN